MSSGDEVRASGMTAAEEVAAEEFAALDETIDPPIADVPHLDDSGSLPAFRRGNIGFARMRVDREADQAALAETNALIDEIILEEFLDAYQLMNDLLEIVRTPEIGPNGQPMVDRFGFVVWKKLPNGNWEEDWSRLTTRERENFLFQISTRLFDWEQRAVKFWSESMMFKAQWEQRFSAAYLHPAQSSPEGKTIESRTSFAKREVAEDRYLAIMEATLSRRADAIVRSLERLGQRLKDTLST
jgi:hypothetical protein